MDLKYSSYSYSSMNKSATETDTATAEESGWTAYFEDFMVAQQQDHRRNNSFLDHHDDDDHGDDDGDDHHHHHHLQQQNDQPELSDAASYVERNRINSSISGATPKFAKNLNLFKKTSRRKREILYDDSLEDTASSPVNSPKVGSSQHMGFNQIKVDDCIHNSLDKGGGFEEQTREMVFQENNNIGSTDLRKRGLCLVPLSIFVNYV